jgi:CRP-like cAMP-binding protein
MAGTTVAAAILTVSLQATLGNVLGGITVQIDGSVHMGEWIRLENGREGKVATIGWRSTVLETRDGDSIVVPNATLLGSAFTILGKRDGRAHPHRMAVNFHVDFRWGPADVCRVVVDALRASPIHNVATDPPPDAVCLDLGRDGRDSMGIYAVRFWLVDVRSDDATASIVRGRIHAALKRAGIPLARPSVTYFNIPTDEETEQARLERRKLRAMATMRQLSLFQVLTESELERVAEQLQFVPFAAGETITRQGATAHYLYILQQGAVEVRINANGDERLVAAMQAPTFFGEIALMTGEPRHASVYATTDVVCFRLEKGVLDTLIHERPAIAEGMSSAIADRSTQLQTVRDDLDANARRVREANERERILQGIRGFFGLDA